MATIAVRAVELLSRMTWGDSAHAADMDMTLWHADDWERQRKSSARSARHLRVDGAYRSSSSIARRTSQR